MQKVVSTYLVALFLLGCHQKNDNHLVGDSPLFEEGISRAVFYNGEMMETSGLAGSIWNKRLLWTHNDSGDEARVFLIDNTGNFKTTVRFENATNRDWKDMAIGVGPEESKSYLYVGDIGDNNSVHQYKYVYRIEEPVIDANKTTGTLISKVDVIKFQYPDGMRDAEALLLDPFTRDLYIISKRERKVNVYKISYPQSTTELITAELVLSQREFEPTVKGDTSTTGIEVLIKGYHANYYHQIVGAAISIDGSEVLVKSYSSVCYWKRESGEELATLLQRPPIILPYTPEPQGEAITFDNEGKGYLL